MYVVGRFRPVGLCLVFMLVVVMTALYGAPSAFEGASPGVRGLVQDLDAPRPLPDNPFPQYPDQALNISVDVGGDVVFLAIVTVEGRVESVRVQDVPAEGVGFEDAVRDAVMRWLFEPARTDGIPRASVYVGRITFTRQLPYTHARIYGQPSEDVWREAREVVSALGRVPELTNVESQILVTPWLRFDATDFGSLPPESAGSEDEILEEFQLHVFVSPFVEPARVHVGSVSVGPNNVQYNLGLAEEWFFQRLEARLDENGRGIPRDAEMHRQVASRLLESPDACLPVLSDGRAQPEPTRLIAVTPIAREGTDAVVTLEVVIALDGAIASSRVVEMVGLDPDGMVVTAAAGAISLWRYSPALSDGCAVPFTGTASLVLRSEAQPETSEAPTYEGTVYGTDDGVELPRLLEEVRPSYPVEALRRGIQGVVLLDAVVLPDGSVGDVLVRHSLDNEWGVDQEAVNVVKQWRFQPGTLEGEPVAVLVTVEVSFDLGEPR